MNAITLEALGITKEEIIDRVVTGLMDEIREDVMTDMEKQIVSKVMTEAQSKINSAVYEAVKTTCGNALDIKFQPLDKWGDKAGKPTTVREMFYDKAKEWWNQGVDAQGKPCSQYSVKSTMAQWHAEQAVKGVISTTLNEEMGTIIKNAQTQVKTNIAQAIANFVAKHLS